jgi:hypothetical protein
MCFEIEKPGSVSNRAAEALMIYSVQYGGGFSLNCCSAFDQLCVPTRAFASNSSASFVIGTPLVLAS